MCVWACSRVCVRTAEVGENPLLLRVMEYTLNTLAPRSPTDIFLYIYLLFSFLSTQMIGRMSKTHTHKAILWSFVDVTSLYHSLLISQFLKGKISQEQINRRKPSKQSNLQIIQIIICINSPHINVKQLIKWNLHNDLSHPDQSQLCA